MAYEFLDSGDNKKLERFGNKVIVRPSSICIWKPKLSKEVWQNADTQYTEKKDWKFKNEKFKDWIVDFKEFKLCLSLQNNGQVGFFPEHYLYLNDLRNFLSANSKVLNLFAYTGIASIYCAKAQAEVTHVDINKKVIGTAIKNCELNNIAKEKVRFINEDTSKFINKEVKRSVKYDLIILDPPSFSRFDNKSWELEQIIIDLLYNCLKLLNPKGTLVFTCHSSVLDQLTVINLLKDFTDIKHSIIKQGSLILQDKNNRSFSCGSLVIARLA